MYRKAEHSPPRGTFTGFRVSGPPTRLPSPFSTFMEDIVFDRLDELAGEYAALERDLADPAVHADPDLARAVGRRYGELGPIVHAYREWQQVSADEATARELADEDASFATEGEQLGRRRAELEDRLQQLLVPKDASDA